MVKKANKRPAAKAAPVAKPVATEEPAAPVAAEPERAHNTDGTFAADNPATPEVNEAYVGADESGADAEAPTADAPVAEAAPSTEDSADIEPAEDSEAEASAEPAPEESGESDDAPVGEVEDAAASSDIDQSDEVAPVATASPEEARAAVQEKQLIDTMASYEDNMDKRIVSAMSMKMGAMAMFNIVNIIAGAPTAVNLKLVLDWFIKHKDGLLAEQKGLRGTDQLAATQTSRVEMTYHVFRTLAIGKKLAVNDVAYISAFRSSPSMKPQDILTWAEKMSKGAAKK